MRVGRSDPLTLSKTGRRVRDLCILVPIVIILLIHVAMLFVGLDADMVRMHAITNIVLALVSGITYVATRRM